MKLGLPNTLLILHTLETGIIVLASIDAFRDKPVEVYFADFMSFTGPYAEDYLICPSDAYRVHVDATCVWIVDW